MSNPDNIFVRPVKTFDDAEHGMKHPSSEPYEVSRVRASELRANGLVVDSEAPEAKAASAPQNKMGAAPINKAVASVTLSRK